MVIKNYTIKEVEFIDKDCIGQTNYVTQEILILKNLSPEQKRQTLIHELTHSFVFAYGFGGLNDQIPLEVMCDFVGIYAEEIIQIADNYIKEHYE